MTARKRSCEVEAPVCGAGADDRRASRLLLETALMPGYYKRLDLTAQTIVDVADCGRNAVSALS